MGSCNPGVEMDLPSLTISNSVCRKLVNSTSAPDAIGPYNQAVMVDRTLYISGQLGMTKSGNLIGGGTLAQVEQALRNIGEILQAAGAVDVGSVLLNKSYL